MEKDPRALAAQLHLTPASVYRWLRGTIPHRRSLLRLANALGVSETWLETGEGPEPMIIHKRDKGERDNGKLTPMLIDRGRLRPENTSQIGVPETSHVSEVSASFGSHNLTPLDFVLSCIDDVNLFCVAAAAAPLMKGDKMADAVFRACFEEIKRRPDRRVKKE